MDIFTVTEIEPEKEIITPWLVSYTTCTEWMADVQKRIDQFIAKLKSDGIDTDSEIVIHYLDADDNPVEKLSSTTHEIVCELNDWPELVFRIALTVTK